jgi:hypothetical protein
MQSLWSRILKTSAIVAFAAATSALGDTVSFDNAPAGASPAGWTATKTGAGEPRWAVERDPSAPSPPNVLRQSGEASYPLCLKAGTSLKAGFVEVKFKPVAGKKDQAGGVVWRAKDADNYYVCRANALEDNIVLYTMVNGKRSALDIVGRQGDYGVKQRVPSGQWHRLRVEFAGSRFTVFFNGQRLFEVQDPTFTDAGQVGLWTKADSLTLFDDFSFGGPGQGTGGQ